MKILPLPAIDAMEVFDACVSSTKDINIRSQFEASRNEVKSWYGYYQRLAMENDLYRVKRFDKNEYTYVFGKVTSKELKNLYSQQLSVKIKPPRIYYDKILAAAPRGKCPFCGFGQASTLDHFLSKSSFPWFSVLPENLVPACKDCNHGKGTKVANIEEEQCLHPYFGDETAIKEQWLFASVQQTSPASAIFHSTPPQAWDPKLKSRVTRHFEDYDLARRFAIEASTEIAGLAPVLTDLWTAVGKDEVQSHLDRIARSSLQLESNSWKSALLQALAATPWYCSGGFRTAN